MKSTAIFVGVNVAASIPIAFCQSAMAEGGAQLSGTADFLKSSLSKSGAQAASNSMLAGEPTFNSSRRQIRIKRDLTPSDAISSPRAMAARNTLAPINGVKLRPFVVGRKLPSASDLAAAAPQYDNGTDPSNLSASISENNYMAPQAGGGDYTTPSFSEYRPTDVRTANRARLKEAARMASGYDRRSAPRSLPNQSPSTPGQVGHPCAQQAVANMHPVRKGNGNDWSQIAADIKSGGFTADMQAEAAKLAATGGESAQAPSGTAGPAPFPLSLLPEASLKQFIGGSAGAAGGPRTANRAAPAAPSYFGSWKGGRTVASSARGALQPCGFHTNLHGFHGNTTAHTISSSAFQTYAPMAMPSHRQMPHMSGEYSAGQHIGQNVHTSSSVNVATYGPYTSNVTY